MSNNIALLIKNSDKFSFELHEHYLNVLGKDALVYNLLYNKLSTVTAKTAKAYLDILITKIPSHVEKLVIADSNYFKFITKIQKLSSKYGALVPGRYDGYTRFTCVYVPHFKSLFKSPENKSLIDAGLNAVVSNQTDIIHNSNYALTYNSDRELLDALYMHDTLAVDIETTGLSLNSSIISISFAWNENEGSAIYFPTNGIYYTKKFFETYTGNLVFHNSLFDVKLLVRDWWMEHSTDYLGMLKGLSYFKNVHDTMLLAYLQKNATTPISLKLKDIAIAHTGNYTIDMDNITNCDKEEILKYNLIDTLATYYSWKKYKLQTLSEPYTAIFQPSIYPIIKMMLTGLPLDNERVSEVHSLLEEEEAKLKETIQNTAIVKEFNEQLQHDACIKRNSELKKLKKTIDDFAHVKFNPFSNTQLSTLLYTKLKFPVLDKTKKGFPKTDAETLKLLKEHISDSDVLELLNNISNLIDVNKINNTFIKAFMKEKDFLHGNFRLGGTQSGRLSSNSPNLTNLPSKGKMGKLVKSCFRTKPGWLFAGADFTALEEKIGTILSNDPERKKIYTQGYDGHSVRAYAYFPEDMPKITAALAKTTELSDRVNIINSIAKLYPELRTKSKAPTFALQYSGTAYTLHKRTGFSMEKAVQIEKAFHSLYAESDKFNNKNRLFMEKHGYVNCAFGLQLKTPIVAQCVLDNSKTPHEAHAEVRSANNAVTQSWGMLLNRAIIATNTRIEEAGYGEHILPINMIHDAVYFMLKDEPKYIKFLNDVLIEEMEWQEHITIASNDIRITAEMEIGKSWADLKLLPNNATLEEIQKII